MTWSNKNDKIIICKNGAYFSLTEDQIHELIDLLNSVIVGSDQYFKKIRGANNEK